MPDVKANELVEARVKFVSLVPRGANGEPFRVIKSDKGDGEMSIDLGGVFLKSGASPRLVFVGAQKATDAVKAMITGSGLSIDDMREAKGGVVFLQGGVSQIPDDTRLFRINDDVIIGVAGMSIEKGFSPDDWSESDFGQAISQQGALPMIAVANEVLKSTIGAALQKAKTPSEAASTVAKAISGFQSYVTGVLKQVPAAAFKMDELANGKTETVDAAKTEDTAAEPAAKAADEAAAAESQNGKTGAEGAAQAAEATEQKSDDAAAVEAAKTAATGETDTAVAAKDDEVKPGQEEPSAAAKADEAGSEKSGDIAALLKTVEALSQSVQAAVAKMEEGSSATKTQLEDLGAKIATVSDRVGKTERSVKSALVGGLQPEELDFRTETRKPPNKDPFNFDSSVSPLN